MRTDWIEYYHIGALLKLALTFVVPFVVFRLLVYAWIKKVGRKPPDFSPLGASMALASIVSAIYYCVIMGITAPTRNIGTEVIRAVIVFPPILLVLLPFCVLYFFFLFRGAAMPSGRFLSLMVVGCLAAEVLWVEYIFGP